MGVTVDQTKRSLLDRAATYAADLGLTDAQLPAFKGYFLDVFITRAFRELEKPLGADP
jgi:hypothetical protein